MGVCREGGRKKWDGGEKKTKKRGEKREEDDVQRYHLDNPRYDQREDVDRSDEAYGHYEPWHALLYISRTLFQKTRESQQASPAWIKIDRERLTDGEEKKNEKTTKSQLGSRVAQQHSPHETAAPP